MNNTLFTNLSWDTLTTILEYAGYIWAVIGIVAVFGAVVLWVRGLLPVLLRLGNGLAKRRIAILARGDALTSLERLLLDSRLFKKRNVERIVSDVDLTAMEQASLFLVYWPDWKDHIRDIVARKRDADALVVYAPQEHGFIPKETMAVLAKERNVTVTNFRGRLLNDVVVSMITTSYEKR